MLKKTMTYTDVNGLERTDDFYFNLNDVELTMLLADLGTNDLAKYAKDMALSGNIKGMLNFCQKMVLNAYGKKSADGRSFVKSQSDKQSFEQSQAYSDLFMELLTKDEEAAKFGQGIVAQAKPIDAMKSEAAAKLGIVPGTNQQ